MSIDDISIVIDRVNGLPPLPSISTHNRDGVRLRTTEGLLAAARLTAHAEITNLGLDPETYGNPIDALLKREPSPFLTKLASAVHNASTATAFGPTPGTTNRPLQVGSRVRLVEARNGIPQAWTGATGTVIETGNPQSLGVELQHPDRPDDPTRTWWSHPDNLEHLT